MIWDMHLCKCICPPSGICPPGNFFNTVTCTCEKNPLPCADGYFWHSTAGACVCNIQACDDPQKYFDYDQCRCVWIPQTCPRPNHPEDPAFSFFDIELGTCVCLPDPVTYPNGCNDVKVTINGIVHDTFWNVATCNCDVVAGTCQSRLYYYDAVSGQCVCSILECGNNEIFD